MRFIGKALVMFLAVIGLLAVILVGATWGVIQSLGSLKGAEAVYEQADEFVLSIDLDADMPEVDSEPWRAAFGEPTLTLRRAIEAIDHAAQDKHVTGLSATLSDSPLSMADIQELRDALRRFHASGKPMQVFAPTIGEGGGGTLSYYLATAFDSIWLQPSGDLGLSGFGIEVPFIQKALAGIGVSAELAKRWEYKNAMDSATREDMSEPHRVSMLRLLESWRSQVIAGAATHSNQNPEEIALLLDGPPLSADEALQKRLVDQVGYADQARQAMATLAGTPDTVSLEDYANEITAQQEATASTRAKKPHIALIQATGIIARGDSIPGDGVNSDDIAQAIHDATNDPDVHAIVLRISSPGGSYVASDTIWRELMLAREADLPVIVSMGDMAASGGYFIAAPATKIVAQPGTITGSIGVYAFKPVLSDMWAKLNVRWETVALSDYANMWSPHQPFSQAQRAQFEKGVDRAYADFTNKVADGRSLTPEMVDKVARGRVWTGADAQNIGLVDALGGEYEAIRLAKQEMGLDPDAPVFLRPFPEQPSAFDALLNSLSLSQVSMAVSSFNQLMSTARPVTQALEQAHTASQGPALLAPPATQARPR